MYLHSRELSLISELVNLSGMRTHKEPLVTVSMLQTLDKDKGEAFILYKRLHPFISRLPDIDSYPCLNHRETQVWYPENVRKVQSVFNFEDFCRNNDNFFLSKLFSGMTHEEIRTICSEEQESIHIHSEDEIRGPVFTSTIPDEEIITEPNITSRVPDENKGWIYDLLKRRDGNNDSGIITNPSAQTPLRKKATHIAHPLLPSAAPL